MPRLTTAQKTSIVGAPAGLIVYDSTKNLFSFFNNSQWTDVKPVVTNDSIWDSYIANNERNVYNFLGQHTYVRGQPIFSIGSSGNIDGALQVSHSSTFPLLSYLLSIDGTGIQARTQGFCFNCPPVNANLLLNRFGGNVGIGLVNPSHAKLELEGTVGNTMAMFKGNSNSAGIALVGDWPGIYANCYYNNGTKSMSSGGYSNVIAFNQDDGSISFLTAPNANTAANVNVPLDQRMRISKEGEILSGTTSTLFNLAPLAVISIGYRFITSNGNTTVTTEKQIIRSSYSASVTGSGVELQLSDDYLYVNVDLGNTGYTELVAVVGNNAVSGSSFKANSFYNYYNPATHITQISVGIDDISNVRWDLQLIIYGLK
jgi:hypothetical protein